jgi:hypothetical protein
MKRKRRPLTAEFKARVAAEALKGEKTIQQIAHRLKQLKSMAPILVGHPGEMHLAGADDEGFAVEQEGFVADAEGSRAVLAWEISNTMDSAFCVRALKEALRRTGRKPKIFNTDQGSQFTGKEWISELQKQDIQISMDGRGRWMDNVFIERLWRSLKYEKLRLWSYQTLSELRALTADWVEFYNHRRKHQTHGYSTPWSIYQPPYRNDGVAGEASF